MGVQPAREMAEERTIQRLPVAAMDEDDDRARAIAGKQIDPVALARTVGITLSAGLMRLAIGRRIARPAGDDRGILRNPRAIIVFDLVVHIRAQRITLPRQPQPVRAFADFCADALVLAKQTHQFADVLRRQVAEDIGNPQFVLRRHLAEFGAAGLGQADHLHAAVGVRRAAVEMPGFDQALDQPGDVAVRDHHPLGDI